MQFQPGAWQPPTAPKLEGPYARNQVLASASKIHVGGVGPEDVLVDAAGNILTGLVDGRILRCAAAGSTIETIANTGGRPLGLELGPEGDVVICDSDKGLLRLTQDGELQSLVSGLDGVPFRFTNNAAVARDGTIYFTDTSRHFGIADYKLDIFEHGGTGRLLVHRPDGQTQVLLDRLHFPNGVALDPNEEYLLVVETTTYSIRKYWLSGPRAGKCETFIDNLPGFPDNLSQYEGIFWVAIPSLRDRFLDWLMPRPRIRRMVARLPAWMQPGLVRHGFALGLDASGNVVHNLQDSTGSVAVVTGIRQYGQKVYLGSLVDTTIAVHDLQP
jgi:sugar lactone lactonase YvrE